MALVNIPRDRDDPNYRYKMPKLVSKIEGRGNGIKTNIFNMGEIARALKRPPMYPTKFFGCELGAMAKFEEAEEKALVNGAHKESDLVNILDKFIQMYVLCPGCELPEIDLIVKKGLLTCKCNACGYQGSLDNVHKAATYMVRNPPDAGSSTMGKKKKSKEERRAEKQEKQAREGKEKKEKEKKKKKADSDDDSDDDAHNGKEASGEATPTHDAETDSWDDEKTEKEKRKEKKKKDKKKSSTLDSEKRLMHKEALVFDSPELKDVIERLRNVVTRSETVDLAAFFHEMRMLQVSQDFDSKCRIYVTLAAIFNDDITPTALEERMPYILKVLDTSVSASDVLDAFGFYCQEKGGTAMTSFPYCLQKLYNAEALEAEDILKYYAADKEDPVFNACKKQAEPFLQWLAEDDGSSEEED
ncbi:UNVERIFIED_CONTAM: eukaryotic initiation factor-5, putative [Hammondia hammondi]|eukprot:XP_008884232.1 eukaryotic initiation factor-5, putative [Hammondia hammondi]